MNQFAATVVQATLEHNLLGPNIVLLQATYTARVQVLTAALRARFQDTVRFDIPGGGYFFWLTLPSHINTKTLLPLAQKAGVGYRPGPGFSPSGLFTNALRVSFALYEVDELEQAADRLSQAFAVYPE